MRRATPAHLRALAAGFAFVLLAGCGERDDAVQPPPLVAPDTTTLGGPGFAADCGMRAEEALRRINAARAAGRQCGRRYMPPAAPLQWDPQLHSAAAVHSLDMARRNYLEHRSPDGRGVRDRVPAGRARWKMVGENLAGGDRSIGGAMQTWMESRDHCENVMEPAFTDVAVACTAQPGTEWGTYWTMVLGRR